MAVMPGTNFLGITDAPMARYDVVCIHTIAGPASEPLARKAHFITDGAGGITQCRDTRFRSTANQDGDHRVISIENEDRGPLFPAWGGTDVPEFTNAQCEAIARICAWAHREHGIPLTLCPNSRPESQGIGYHRQGIPGNWETFAFGGIQPGGEVWTFLPRGFGKVCPGDRRIRQIINTIIPRAREIAGLDSQEDDVALSSLQWAPGERQWGVVAVPPVGRSLSVGPQGQAWLHLRCPHEPVTIHGLWAVDTEGGQKLLMEEAPLNHDTYHRWQLPANAVQVSALYSGKVPIAATLETKALVS